MVVFYVTEKCGRVLCYRGVWSCSMLERSVVVYYFRESVVFYVRESVVVSYVREECGRVVC